MIPERKYSYQTYDLTVANKFKTIESEISRLANIGKATVKIHHVGSTSIPGMGGKPTIDIALEVKSLVGIEKAKTELEQLGYEFIGRDYVEPNSLFFAKSKDYERLVNVHVFESSNPKLQQMLDTRDYLRAHPKEAKEYEDLKASLAKQFPSDYESYRNSKYKLLEQIKVRASKWSNNSRNDAVKIVFFDGDGTLWYPETTKRTKPPHWVYLDETIKDPIKEFVVSPGTIETLKKLGELGIKKILVSTSPLTEEEAVMHRIELTKHIDIHHLLDEIVAAPDRREGKGEKIVELLEKYKLQPKDALIVGDLYNWDYKPAQDVGVKGLLINSEYGSEYAKEQGVQPDEFIDEVSDVLTKLT